MFYCHIFYVSSFFTNKSETCKKTLKMKTQNLFKFFGTNPKANYFCFNEDFVQYMTIQTFFLGLIYLVLSPSKWSRICEQTTPSDNKNQISSAMNEICFTSHISAPRKAREKSWLRQISFECSWQYVLNSCFEIPFLKVGIPLRWILSIFCIKTYISMYNVPSF